MNKILEEIISTGTTKTIDGKTKVVKDQISKEEGKLIQSSIKETNAQTSVEIGLAFGVSALYICDALKKTDKTKHYVIDPYQMHEGSYSGIGLNNLKRAGYENIVEFMEKPSHQALAELEQRNLKVDFAFIDGWHTFDHALVDFFLVDKILNVGGIVILDDTDWQAIQKLSSFILNNRAYKFTGGSPQRSYLSKKNSYEGSFNPFKKLKNCFIDNNSGSTKLYGAMAFLKISDDLRSWNSFESF